jgi:NADH dehydrogenase [ubiquinone] 1 alpha subcomplex assembly factor 5
MQMHDNDNALILPLILELQDRLLDVRVPFQTGLWHGQKITPIDHGLNESLADCQMTFCADDDLDNGVSSVDLAISFLEMHWFENIPGYLDFMHAKLSDKGLFLGVMWGGETLYELKDALICTEAMAWGSGSVRAAPMVSAHDMAALMQKSPFFAPVVDVIPFTVTYNCLNDLVRDLRIMGETEALITRNPRYCGKRFWHEVEQFLLSQHNVSGSEKRFKITFQALFILGWKNPNRAP